MSAPNRRLARYWLLTLAAFAGGIALLWSYLDREHRRLTPVEVALLWSSETVSGFWFVRFGVRHLLLGRPVPVIAGDGEFRVIWVTLLAGWLLDVGLTAYKHFEESAALRRSVATVGRVLEVRHHQPTYELHGDYVDAGGVAHPVSYIADGVTVPAVTRLAIDLQRLPAPLPLRYDPDRPDRTWLQGEGTGSDRVYIMTGIFLIFQGVLLERLRAARRSPRGGLLESLPAEQVGPFAISAAGLLVMGVLRWLPGFPLF